MWLESADKPCACPFNHNLCTQFVLNPLGCLRGAACARQHTSISLPAGVLPRLDAAAVVSPGASRAVSVSATAAGDAVAAATVAVAAPGVKETYVLPVVDPAWNGDQLGAYNKLKAFVESEHAAMRTPPGMPPQQRAIYHAMAELFGLHHQSVARGRERGVYVTRMSAAEFQARQKQEPVVLSMPPPEPTFDADENEIYNALRAFVLDKSATEFTFPPGKAPLYRKKIHQLAMDFELEHEAVGQRGSQTQRSVLVRKVPASVLAMRRELRNNLVAALAEFSGKLGDDVMRSSSPPPLAADGTAAAAAPAGPPATPAPSGALRYVSFNIEWMDYLFASDTEFLTANPGADITDVASLCGNIAFAIRQLAPDLMAVVEGPASAAKMDLFQRAFLNDEYDVLCNDDLGTQSIFFLVRRNGPVSGASLYAAGDAFLREEWRVDTKGDLNLAEYAFTRRPLVIKAHAKLNGSATPVPFYAVAMHTKSKFIGGGQRMWESTDFTKKLEFVRKACGNRRRIAAECLRVRHMIDQVIYAEDRKPLVVVSGDLNDGPGSDVFEQLFLLVNPCDLVMGSPFARHKLLQAVLIRKSFVPADWQYSAVFDDYVDKREKKVLLDHIMLSNDLAPAAVAAGVAHDIFQACVVDGVDPRSRQARISDHMPVFCDLK